MEANAACVGGKETNKHVSKRKSGQIGGVGKQVVHALVERGDRTPSHHIANVTGKTLAPILFRNVSRKSALMTDTGGEYLHLGKYFARHGTVNHTVDEYVRGDAYSNMA